MAPKKEKPVANVKNSTETRSIINPIAFIEPRNTGSIWLAFLRLLIPKILELINAESADEIAQNLKVPKTSRCPSARQINEARQNLWGFAKLAIPLVMKYQDTVNVFADKFNDAASTRLVMKGFFPNPNEIPKDMIESIKIIIKKILNQEKEINNVEQVLAEMPKEIDDLIGNFMVQWKDHEQKFNEILIQQLEAELGTLSDAEKMAIRNKTKTISEIRNDLKKSGVDIKKFGKTTKFTLRAAQVIVSNLSSKLKQSSITTNNVSKTLERLKALSEEQKQAKEIADKQKSEYKKIDKTLKEMRNKMEKFTLIHDRRTLENLHTNYHISLKKAAVLQKTAAAEKLELE
jgi:hypothetical protein